MPTLLKIVRSKIFFSFWVYLGWFGCVYCGKMNWGLASLLFPFFSWLLVWINFRPSASILFRLIVLLVIGIVFDCTAVHLNLIQTTPPAEFGWLPLWLISLWLVYISSIPIIQFAFQKKYWLAALLGAVFGPLSYHAGAQFGLLTMNGASALFIYAIFWSAYIPVSLHLVKPQNMSNDLV